MELKKNEVRKVFIGFGSMEVFDVLDKSDFISMPGWVPHQRAANSLEKGI